jgi:hypothetical protein
VLCCHNLATERTENAGLTTGFLCVHRIPCGLF